MTQFYEVEIGPRGRQIWRQNGEIHREDGPAVINGEYEAWYRKDELHREDGPAVINGEYEAWYRKDQLHREDGPAIIDEEYKAWYLNGVLTTEEEVMNPAKEMTVAEIEKLVGYKVKIVKE